jgi:hypothetical protein
MHIPQMASGNTLVGQTRWAEFIESFGGLHPLKNRARLHVMDGVSRDSVIMAHVSKSYKISML